MTAIDKLDAEELKQQMYCMAKGRCTVCGKQLAYSECQLAHRIPKGYVKMYGPKIIHHPLNMRITCADCNSSVLINPGSNPIEADELIQEIWQDLKK